MGFTIERRGLISKEILFTRLIKDLAINGFTPIWLNKNEITDDPSTFTSTKAVFEAGPTIDALNDPITYPNEEDRQPWRLLLDGTVAGGQWAVGTHYQIQDDGTTIRFSMGAEIAPESTTIFADQCGNIGHAMTGMTGIVPDANLTLATPYSYRLSLTDRGMAFETWQEIAVNGVRHYSWVCVQRLVDPVSGKTQLTGHCPVVALYTSDGGKKIYQIIAREMDVIAPTQSVLVSVYADYSNQVINCFKQTVMSETNQYYVIFPAGFTSARHLYSDEMDMIAYTSAGVLSQYNDALVNVYGRAYVGFQAGKANAGNPPIVLGDLIKDATTNATGVVAEIILTSGSWTANNAAGTIVVSSFQKGTNDEVFKDSHNINNVTKTFSNIATCHFDSVVEYRTYKGGCSNIGDAEGMRALILVDKGGI